MRGVSNLNSHQILGFILALIIPELCSIAIASPPQIDPDNEFVLKSNCIYESFQETLKVIDTDGDYISVNSTLGDIINTQFYVDIDGVGHWEGYLSFDKTTICDERSITDLIISADDLLGGVDTLDYGEIYLLGRIDFSMGANYLYPGGTAAIPIYINTFDCFEMGGFSVTFESDPELFNVVDVYPGNLIRPYGLYFVWDGDPNDEGIDKLIFIAEPESTLTGIPRDQPVAYFELAILPDAPVTFDSTYSVCFYDGEPHGTYNAVADKSGLTTWYETGCESDDMGMKTECGELTVVEWPLDLGDINLNGFPYETGDMALAHNAIKDMITYPLSNRQWHNGDIDEDGKPLTIRDMFSIIEGINGVGNPGDPLPFTYSYNPDNDTILIESVTLAPGDQFNLPMYMINHDTLFDFQVNFDIDTSILVIDSLVFTGEVEMTYTNPPEAYHMLSYDFDNAITPEYYNHFIAPGNYHLCDIYGNVKANVVTPGVTSITMTDQTTNGTYTGCVCAEFFEPVIINSTINIDGGGYAYLPGDVNMYYATWPPQTLGNDVTYLVNYFRGFESSYPCMLNGLFASADINGDCQVIGSDVTLLVNYFRAIAEILYCEDYQPIWLSEDDLPAEMPNGWPSCEE